MGLAADDDYLVLNWIIALILLGPAL